MRELSEEVKRYYNQIAGRYDCLYLDKASLLENQIVSDRLKIICDGKDILDLGCGTGLALELCNPRYYTGLDISEGMLEIAKKKAKQGYDFILDDLNNEWESRFSSKKFEVIISLFSSLSQIEDLGAAVNKCRGLLADRGKIYIMTLNRGLKHKKIEKYNVQNLQIDLEGVPTHFYSKADIEEIFAGWDDLKVTLV